MIKIVTPASFGFDEPLAQLVKVSSRGLIGSDLNAFIKRAGVNFLPDLEQLRPGEVPVHWLAVGAREYYGANRNGDGFDEDDCDAHHDTFRKYGRFNYDHVNKDPKKSYGRIVKSAYHKPMHRIELLLGLSATKEAAERNGGLVAKRTLEKLASGKDVDGSMACRVAHDVCDHCGNKARSRDEYCDDRPVKLASREVPACSGFGCRKGLTKIASDGRQQFVHNPRPIWFDFSDVERKADRIASSMGILEKAASSIILGGAGEAELLGVTAPPGLFLSQPATLSGARQLKLATELAQLENSHQAYSAYDGGLVSEKIASFPEAPRPVVLRALADAGVVLDVANWLEFVGGKEAADVSDEVSSRLPGIYGRLMADDALPGDLDANPYLPSASVPPVRLREWATKLAITRNVAGAEVARRAVAAAARGAQPANLRVKSASASLGAEKLARQYALYQLATLERLTPDPQCRTAGALLVRRNAIA